MSAVTAVLLRHVRRLRRQRPLAGREYYHVRFYADAEGRLQQSIDGQWVGFTATKPRREIRGPRRVDPRETLKAHAKHRMPALLVNRPGDMLVLMAFGGFGVIERSVAEDLLPRLCQPQEMLRDSTGLGYVIAGALPKHKLQHAPSPAIRMRVLKRDGARCALCGRSPAAHVDIELHVHHSIPWGDGGITEEENLVTLCRTCHKGLEPHSDPAVRSLLKRDESIASDYRKELERYQRLWRRWMENADDA